MNMRLILLLALLLSLPALVPLAATAEGDQGVLHPLLREKLATAASDEQLEIIVQFRPAMTVDDLAVARAGRRSYPHLRRYRRFLRPRRSR